MTVASNKTVKITWNDPEFPEILKNIPDPPNILYCRGDIGLLKRKSFAVVGSRAATDYGRWVADNLGERIAMNGATVVSGMAQGIDGAAHKGALKARGKTIAVLGNGVDICYPASNVSLYNAILDKGLIVSEYPDGFAARKYTFPLRNRIISGLSIATVIVEAGLKSGSLITANIACDQGREVYAVPGNLNRKTSFGCNKLIADGARILVTFDQLLTDNDIDLKSTTINYSNLSDIEKTVLEKILNSGETTLDILSEELGVAIQAMSGIVTILEMKGYIHTDYGKIFIEN